MSGLMSSLGIRRLYHSGDAAKMLNYASKVNPSMTAFIKENKLWELILNYSKKQYYIEKSVLFDPHVADIIAKNICDSSMATRNSKFIDMTAGLGLISSSVHSLQRYQRIYSSEESLIEALRLTAKKHEGPNGLVVLKKNLLKDKHLVNMLRSKHVSLEDRCWELNYPQITFFGIVSHACIKRLTYSLKQYHVSLANNDVVTTLYNYGRPEFYFLISHRTLIHITSKPGQHMVRNASNVLFQLLFDMEVISNHPREAFLPWKNFFNKKSTPSYEKLFPELESSFYLIRAVPRSTLYQLESPESISYFPFFLRAILGKRKKRVFELIDTFIPHISKYLQEGSGISPKKETGFLSNNEIMSLFNLVVKHPDFQGSTFRGAAMEYEEESSTHDFTPKVMTDAYDVQRKTLLTSGSFNWNEYAPPEET